jgi:hypothetical protein
MKSWLPIASSPHKRSDMQESSAKLPPDIASLIRATLAANFTGPGLVSRSLPISARRQLTPSNARILAVQLFLDFIDQLIGHDATA